MDELSQLICQLQQGSDRALWLIMTRWRQPMELLAKRLLADSAGAEDVVQEALLILWQKRHLYNPTKLAWPWVAQIIRRLCYQRWRRRGGRRQKGITVDVSLEMAGYLYCPCPQPSVSVEQQELIALAKAKIEEMPPSWREVIQLTLLDEESEADAAALLGISRGTVKSRKHRALTCLRQHLHKAIE